MKQNNKSLNELANNGNKFLLVKREETKFWTKNIATKAELIDCVYLIILKEPTHLCELAVSYRAVAIRNVVKNFEAFTEDELTEIERDNGDERETYFTGDSVFNIVKRYRSGKEEDILEYETCNQTYC